MKVACKRMKVEGTPRTAAKAAWAGLSCEVGSKRSSAQPAPLPPNPSVHLPTHASPRGYIPFTRQYSQFSVPVLGRTTPFATSAPFHIDDPVRSSFSSLFGPVCPQLCPVFLLLFFSFPSFGYRWLLSESAATNTSSETTQGGRGALAAMGGPPPYSKDWDIAFS